MPTYDYKCDSCGYYFELFQNMTDQPLSNCPKCNAAVRRLFGAGAGFLVKGGGASAADNVCKSRCGSNGPSCGLNSPCCGMVT